jgi:hypothetical protein
MSRYQQQRHIRAQSRQEGFAQRFGIAEHLSENFAASCSDVCAQTDIAPTLRSACDMGSQAYCSTADNIASIECNPYVDRLIRTRAAEKASTVYSNPVIIPSSSGKTITDYYNALGDAANSYVASNITNLSSTSVAGLMNVMKAEGGDLSMFNKVADTAITGCVQSSTASCSVPSIKSRVDKLIGDQVQLFATASVGAILDYISTNVNHYLKFEDSYAPMRTLLLSKMSFGDINNPALIVLREKSATICMAVDLLVINYVCDSTLTTIPTSTSGDYTVDLSAKPKLYAKSLDTFIYTILSRPYAPTDKLLKLYAAASNSNVSRCATVDPLTDPTCIAIRQTGRSDAVTLMDTALAKYCVNPSAITSDSCVNYVAGLTDATIKTAALVSGYNAAVKADGSIDVTVLNKYGSAMKDWIKTKTADIVTKNAAGETIITPSCGTANSLPVDQCKQICALYPDVCLEDQIRKAQLPQYRYNKDGFSNPEKFNVGSTVANVLVCSPDTDEAEFSVETLLVIILFAIACAFAFAYVQRHKRQRNRSEKRSSDGAVDQGDYV